MQKRTVKYGSTVYTLTPTKNEQRQAAAELINRLTVHALRNWSVAV